MTRQLGRHGAGFHRTVQPKQPDRREGASCGSVVEGIGATPSTEADAEALAPLKGVDSAPFVEGTEAAVA